MQDGQIPVETVQSVMVLDPAGGGKDEYAYAVVYAWAGTYYLVRSGGQVAAADETFYRHLALVAKQHGVKEIVIENNFGGLEVHQQAFKPFLREVGHLCNILPYRSTTKKEQKIIDILSPLTQTHSVAIDRRVIDDDLLLANSAREDEDLSYSLFHQYTHLTNETGSLRHDDRLESFAIACEHFQSQASEDQHQRQTERAIEHFKATIPDREGVTLYTLQRRVMGLTLEQAKEAQRAAGQSASGNTALRKAPTFKRR
jgi:hypothetical protein